jgi:pathogenesis-related protein 1
MRWVMLLGFAFAPAMPDQMLDAHNAVRAKLHLPPLVWSEKLAKAAQEWANMLIKEGTFHHPAKSPWGQNLYAVSGGEYLPEQIVNGWASEASQYDYKNNQCTGMCGHYTQLVWRATREVGCAVARGGNREVWVCDYSPPGNHMGMRPY